MAIYLGATPAALPGPAYLGGVNVYTPPPDWPEGAVAVWLILGQSNADGYAPYEQDPARADPLAAVPALTAAERLVHDWIKFTPAGVRSFESGGPGDNFTGGQFSKRGLATAAPPRTASKVWTPSAYGIPNSTPSFGPEVGLVRHVLTDPSAAKWRDDATPRLRVLKAVLGGTSVDRFRSGGPAEAFALGAVMTAAGPENLASLASSANVLLQGAVYVIGEADANLLHPDGSGARMTGSFADRFREWIRQLRHVLGTDLPVALVQVFDNGPDRAAINAQLAILAASIPNAAVIESAGWESVGDGTHYDAAAQKSIGAAAFGWIRAAHGRLGDGLVTDHPFTGFRPALVGPPVFSTDGGTQMKVSGRATTAGILHGLVLAAGSPAPSIAEVVAGTAVPGYYAQFHRNIPAPGDFDTFTLAGTFAGGTTQDCHMVFEEVADGGPTGRLTPLFILTRAGSVKFSPPPSATPTAGGGVTLAWQAAAPGTDTWAIWPGDVPVRRPEDVEAGAFEPVAFGRVAGHGPNNAASVNASGLAPGAVYTAQVAIRRSVAGHPDDGRFGETRRVTFTAIA